MRKRGPEHEPIIGCSLGPPRGYQGAPLSWMPRFVLPWIEVYAHDVAQNAAGCPLPHRAIVPVQVSMFV